MKIPHDRQSEKTKLFNSYPVNKQIDIYLFALSCCEPSNTIFERYLKENGESKIKDIAEAIKNKKNPREKANLIGMLFYIDKDCDCVAANENIMEILVQNKDLFGPNANEIDKGWEKSYNWVLFEFQRKNPNYKTKIKNSPNPYSNSNIHPN